MPQNVLLNGDCLEQLKQFPADSIDSLITDPPAGISFMNKEWDDNKGGRKQWIAWMTLVMTEVLRVLKPGAHGLVWALPRTSHWTATALEEAGFEVRDVVTHLFGQGFPKSLDVSKAIDKAAGTRGEIIEQRKAGITNGLSKSRVSQGARPTVTVSDGAIRAPSTDAAKQWQGWGTALKPASEHWILVRKPCSEKTVAANVLRWGTGALNIDISRIESPGHPGVHHAGSSASGSLNWNAGEKVDSSKEYYTPKGRFPANLVLSHSEFCTEESCDLGCAISALNAQSGILQKRGNKGPSVGYSDRGFIKQGTPSGSEYNRDDTGGAARFFYCAKISKSERGEGNTHPTVKPKKLMTYLIRMITPPGGVVLDPFMGSGSTGVACAEAGFDFIGIEKELEYFIVAGKRINKNP